MVLLANSPSTFKPHGCRGSLSASTEHKAGAHIHSDSMKITVQFTQSVMVLHFSPIANDGYHLPGWLATQGTQGLGCEIGTPSS